jgi:hypothetical protein
MKALDSPASIHPDHTVKVPPEIAAQVESEQSVRVILLIPEATDDQEWSLLTVDQFLKGYADSDAIYDDLPVG